MTMTWNDIPLDFSPIEDWILEEIEDTFKKANENGFDNAHLFSTSS